MKCNIILMNLYAVCILITFLNCNKSPSQPQLPPMVTVFSDSSGSIDDTVAFYAVSSDSSHISKYIWILNNSSSPDTTIGNCFKTAWNDTGVKKIILMAIDNNGLVSKPETSSIKIKFNAPYVEIMDSITISINDTLYLGASAFDNGSIVKYAWALDGKNFKDTTSKYYIRSVWRSSGIFPVIVKAIDNHGQVSQADTCKITVLLNPPVVHIMGDSSVNIKDTISIKAKATDNEGIAAFIWSKNGIQYTDTTESGTFRTAWRDSGIKKVWVKAMDNDGILSEPDSCLMKVTLDPPKVFITHDTLVSTKQEVTFKATSQDNGRVIRYFWNISGRGYKDSTDIGSFKITWTDSGLKTVSVIAMDDDSILSAPDTCFVSVKSLGGSEIVRSIPVTLLSPNPDFIVDSCYFVKSSPTSEFIYAVFPVVYKGDSDRQFVYLDSICYKNIAGGIISFDDTYLHKRNMQLNSIYTNTCIKSGDTCYGLTVRDSIYSQLASITIKRITYSNNTNAKVPDAKITLKSFRLDGLTLKMIVTNEGTKSAKLTGTDFFVLRDNNNRPVYHWMAFPNSNGSILAPGAVDTISGTIIASLPDWKSVELIPAFEDVQETQLSKRNANIEPAPFITGSKEDQAILAEMKKRVQRLPK